jgi:type IX secretion system substrate protein/lamin tail-like protein
MKRVLLFIFAIVSTMQLSAQCSELFLSGYVEGYGNNRALEIYNPTNTAIDLSGYSVGRYSNGDAAPNSFEGIQLPADMIEPYGTYVVVIEKLDSLGTGLETPVWNGYQLWDVVIDEVTGDTVLDMNGDPVYDVQYDLNNNNIPFYGNVYHEWLDLQGKADAFLCPVYDINNAMYFNGNDAVCLISGTTVMPDGSNLIDVIGVIGEDPGQSWETSEGEWITRDRSLTRKAYVGGGTGFVVAALGDTIAYENWDISFKNDFSGLGWQVCNCEVTALAELNQVPFKMFPNPLTSNELTIEAAENMQQLVIFNILGETVFLSNLNGFNQNATLSIPDLNAGIYTVAIQFEGNKKSIQKLMIGK